MTSKHSFQYANHSFFSGHGFVVRLALGENLFNLIQKEMRCRVQRVEMSLSILPLPFKEVLLDTVKMLTVLFPFGSTCQDVFLLD